MSRAPGPRGGSAQYRVQLSAATGGNLKLELYVLSQITYDFVLGSGAGAGSGLGYSIWIPWNYNISRTKRRRQTGMQISIL